MKTKAPSSVVSAEREGPVDGIDAARAHSGNGSRMNRIAHRAHRIYERRGGEHGTALDDWLQAEREIDAED